MKRTSKLFLAGLAIAAAVACQPTAKELKMESFERADSTVNAQLSMNVELPVPVKGPAGHIRTKLIEIIDDQLCHIASYEDEPRLFPAYEGNPFDTKALMGYYIISKSKRAENQKQNVLYPIKSKCSLFFSRINISQTNKEGIGKSRPFLHLLSNPLL